MKHYLLIAMLLLMSCNTQNKTDPRYVNSPVAEEYFTKGSYFFWREEYDSAILVYSDLLQIEPRNLKAYDARARSKECLKDYKGALNDYTTALQIDPHGIFIARRYVSRGSIKYELNDFQGAILDYTSAIEVDEGWADAYWMRALVKKDIGDSRGAINDFTQYIKMPSGNPANQTLAYYYMGILKISIGFKEEGCIDLSRAGELGFSKAYEAINNYCH